MYEGTHLDFPGFNRRNGGTLPPLSWCCCVQSFPRSTISIRMPGDLELNSQEVYPGGEIVSLARGLDVLASVSKQGTECKNRDVEVIPKRFLVTSS